ncbi:unnamed protein product [Adineta steineri]|uniref:G-protein coupled receptors family 1 profile domain-containing protein n=1 Tax=Adineta steineri TaxID=433720 RepID=A0A815QZ02_9BILA|nr:unnamed protein product [Adineta steineri]CAF4107370.1 unnamed protein product [Adineta steineri]
MSSVSTYLYEIISPILMIFGTAGSIINIIVFSQKNLRKNPCSIYFIAYNIVNFMYIYFSLLPQTMSSGYNIDYTTSSIVSCRLYFYAIFVLNALSSYYLILASIDRTFITSSNALTRQRSTCRLAYICIGIGTLFWILFHIHALIFTNIVQAGPNVKVCAPQRGTHNTFTTYYNIIEEMIVISLMLIFGISYIKNIRNLGRIQVPAVSVSATRANQIHGSNSFSRKDRQWILMLLMETTIYAVCVGPFAFYLIYLQITLNEIKSTERLQLQNMIYNILIFTSAIPFCTGCYTNLIVSKTFRAEVKKIFSWIKIFNTR